jgi:hypothetical protein
MPSRELTKMLYSGLENAPNSILPRRHVHYCIDLDGESMLNGRRAPDKEVRRNRRPQSGV